VNEISDVVFATNNQNSMQPRNLVSNSFEQVQYARFFANDIGWFYEAKQGAWEAFRKDSRRWKPRITTPPKQFKQKRIDNHVLAQDWLAFLGFADKADNDKRYLFDRDKDYYNLIFMRRANKHAFNNYSNISEAIADSENNSPDPYMMLIAHVTRIFANKVVPSSQANKKQALSRKGIEDRSKISPQEEEKILSEDAEYKLNQALNAMSRIFVEFVGYTFFQVFGSDTHRLGSVLATNHSWRVLIEKFDLDVVTQNTFDRTFHEHDLLVVLWLFFREAVQGLMAMQWETSYRNARYKPRFLLNSRGQIYNAIQEMDSALKRHVPMRVYTSGIQDNEGFFGYVERVVNGL
jgi:hypothetical protein